MSDHSNHPQLDIEDGAGQDGRYRLSRSDNAILIALSQSPTFLKRDEIVRATWEFPNPYQISYAMVRRRMPLLRRCGFVERRRGDGGFRITALGEKAKHAI
jgi:hypothetical protein